MFGGKLGARPLPSYDKSDFATRPLKVLKVFGIIARDIIFQPTPKDGWGLFLILCDFEL